MIDAIMVIHMALAGRPGPGHGVSAGARRRGRATGKAQARVTGSTVTVSMLPRLNRDIRLGSYPGPMRLAAVTKTRDSAMVVPARAPVSLRLSAAGCQ